MRPPGHLDPGPALRQARLRVLEADRRPTAKTIARVLGVDPRSVHRYTAGQRLTRCQADRIAVHLGFHPLNLWPEWNAA